MKELLDEIAMSMPWDSMPEFNTNVIEEVSEEIGFEFDQDDVMKQVEWSLRLQAHIRYKYANIMLEERKKYLK